MTHGSDEVPSIADMIHRWEERAKAFDALPQAEKDRISAEVEMGERDRLREDMATRLSAVPARYRDAQLSDSRVADWAEYFLKGGRRSLLLTGPTSVGKTHSMFAIYRAIVEADPYRAPRLEYQPVPMLLANLRPSPPEGMVEHLRSCRLLFLDDLGANKESDWTRDILFQIIDDRYSWDRPTVFATNLPAREMAEILGDRLTDRLHEICQVIAMTGENRRRAG